MKTLLSGFEILSPTTRRRFRSFSSLVENADAISDRSSLLRSCSSPHSDGLDSRAATEVSDQDEITCSNKIITRHIRSGDLDSAMKVFQGMRAKNIVTWNTILAGVSKVPGRVRDAQKLFDEIPHSDIFSYNTMLSCYVRNSDLRTARSFFDRMPVRDVASWNTMITGYARLGQLERAREMFSAMPEKNEVTWNAMISGYVECGDLEAASSIFRAAPVKSVVAWTAMITGYMRSKKVGLAEAVFRDMLVKKNLVTWNAMISGYVENSLPEDGLKLFRAMLEDGIRPNPSSLSSVLLGCSELSALQLGRQVHQLVCKSPLSNHTTASTSLISMYCKCGDLGDAWKLFMGMTRRDVVAWNAMISGYAQHGQAQKALELFQEMRDDGIRPDWITFVAVLLACNHAGLVEAGMEYFDSMVRDYGVQPRPDHYTCMVDLTGRAGKLDEALKLVKAMPFRPHAAVYGTLLGACRLHKNVEVAEFAAKKLLELQPNSAAGYVQLANVYASKNQWQEVARIRTKMKENKVVKVPGYSWIEIGSEVHEFRSGDRVHKELESIEEKLEEMGKRMKEEGYVHELEYALHGAPQ